MNTLKKHTISLCMGSSCYVNGNVTMLQFIQQFLKENALEQNVELKGSLCQNNCKNGPAMVIDKESYSRLNSAMILKILTEKLLETAGKRE
jgi:NADH:ubiquinone oxidoreductase subunit E